MLHTSGCKLPNQNETGRHHMHQVLMWAELLVPSFP